LVKRSAKGKTFMELIFFKVIDVVRNVVKFPVFKLCKIKYHLILFSENASANVGTPGLSGNV
jgi:hypothetical protein